MNGVGAYVGVVGALGAEGFRITLIDWFTGAATSWDFWVPWSNVLGMLVATKQHDLTGFGDVGAKWQLCGWETRSMFQRYAIRDDAGLADWLGRALARQNRARKGTLAKDGHTAEPSNLLRK